MIMDIAYCTAMKLIVSKLCVLDALLGISNVVSIFSIEEICVTALAPAVRTISGSKTHHIYHPSTQNNPYFSYFSYISFINNRTYPRTSLSNFQGLFIHFPLVGDLIRHSILAPCDV